MARYAEAQLSSPPLTRRMIVLLGALLILAAITVEVSRASVASAQATYTIPIQYNNGLGYGGYGLGYGGYGYGGYGLGYGGYGYGGYGLGYGGYGYGGYGLGYGGYGYGGYGLGYGLSNSNYLLSNTYTTTGSYASSAPTVGITVGLSWLYCTGPNGPVWVRGGSPTTGLLC